MAEHYFALSKDDQSEVLEIAREKTGRPAHLLEKDIWVVWVLSILFESSISSDLTFKGGTSLSKAYKIIDRFSEDIDLTYDIRKLLPDLVQDEAFLPSTRSQAHKWTAAVRERLPKWISGEIQPLLQSAIAQAQLDVRLEQTGVDGDKLLLHYQALKQGTGYVSPTITLEFGGRATGEPHQILQVTCDAEDYVDDIQFPVAQPLVMSVTRTFWEKATAAHVYCAQGRLRGERYARHWHDLVAIMRSPHFEAAINDRAVAKAVAEHKSLFFSEKTAAGETIDYFAAIDGALNIVPRHASREALASDYAAMYADEVMLTNALSFDDLMQECSEVTALANKAAR